MPTARGIRAGRAFVELFADDNQLVRGLRRAERRLRVFGSRINAVSRSMATIGTAAAVPLAISTKTFAAFDDQMRATQAVIGATEQEFLALTDKAKELGRTTSFTAAQVAGAMLEMGRAGFVPEDIDKAIGAVLSLARATGTELPRSAGIASDTLRAFGLDARDLVRVSDVLTATANNSAQTLEDLAEAMKYAAPVADEYGMTLEQTSKTLGALANFGIKGSLAGNTIKNIMLQIANPDVRKRIASLGVSVTDAGGQLRDVADLLRDVGTAAATMPPADRLALYNELFGKRAIAGGAKLAAASFDKLNAAVDSAAGTADKTARMMDAGIGGTLRKIWSAVEGTAIATGTALAPALKDMGDRIIFAAGAVTRLLTENPQLITAFAKLTAYTLAGAVALRLVGLSIGGLATVFGVLTTAVRAALVPLRILATVIVASFTNPIAGTVLAVAALGAAILIVSGKAGKAVAWLGDKFATLKEDSVASFNGIADALAAGDIATAAKILWLQMKLEWTRGMGFLEKTWLDIKGFFVRLSADTIMSLSAMAAGIWEKIETGFIDTVRSMDSVLDGFARNMGDASNWMAKAWGKSLNWIKAKFDDTFDVDAANRAQDQYYQARKNELDQAAKKREAERQDARDRAASIHAGTMADIGKKNAEARRALDEEYASRTADTEAELAAARQEWQAAITAAREARAETAGATDTGPGTAHNLASRLKATLSSVGDIGDLVRAEAQQLSVSGTFSAAVAGRLGAGDAVDRTARATEQTASNTKRITQQLAGGTTLAFS